MREQQWQWESAPVAWCDQRRKASNAESAWFTLCLCLFLMFSVLCPEAPVTVSQFVLTQRDDSSLSVSWLAPRQRSRTSVEYEVMFFEKVRTALFVLSPFTQRSGSVLCSTCICYLTLFDFCRERRHVTQWSIFLSPMSLWETCSQTQPTCFVWDPSHPLDLGPTPRSRNFALFHQVNNHHWYLIWEKLTSLSDFIFIWQMDLFLSSASCKALTPHSWVPCHQG